MASSLTKDTDDLAKGKEIEVNSKRERREARSRKYEIHMRQQQAKIASLKKADDGKENTPKQHSKDKLDTKMLVSASSAAPETVVTMPETQVIGELPFKEGLIKPLIEWIFWLQVNVRVSESFNSSAQEHPFHFREVARETIKSYGDRGKRAADTIMVQLRCRYQQEKKEHSTKPGGPISIEEFQRLFEALPYALIAEEPIRYEQAQSIQLGTINATSIATSITPSKVNITVAKLAHRIQSISDQPSASPQATIVLSVEVAEFINRAKGKIFLKKI